MKRLFEAAVFFGLGVMLGALAQASSELDQDHKAPSYCVPLYDQPGIERVQCDPVDGAK